MKIVREKKKKVEDETHKKNVIKKNENQCVWNQRWERASCFPFINKANVGSFCFSISCFLHLFLLYLDVVGAPNFVSYINV